MGSGDGLGYTLVSAGGILVYAALKGYSVTQVLGNVITGKPIMDGVNQQPLGGGPAVTPQQVPGSSGTNVSAAGSTAAANQQLGKTLAKGYGWDEGAQWDALVKLWTKESDWDNHALNIHSGAYGIPQALPYTKMPKEAWPETAGGQASPTAQITWGLAYIAGRYGVPQFAWSFHVKNNWY